MTIESIKSKEDKYYVVPSDALIPVISNDESDKKSVTPDQIFYATKSRRAIGIFTLYKPFPKTTYLIDKSHNDKLSSFLNIL